MSASIKRARAFFAAMAVIGVISGLTAGLAAAAPVQTTWNIAAPTTMKWATTGITVEKNGGSGVLCTLSANPQTGKATNEGGVGSGYVYQGLELRLEFSCPEKTSFKLLAIVNPYVEGSTRFLKLHSSEFLTSSPFGAFSQTVEGWGTFVNGFGSMPSSLTFFDDVIGYDTLANAISITGKFQVTTGTGGLLTIS